MAINSDHGLRKEKRDGYQQPTDLMGQNGILQQLTIKAKEFLKSVGKFAGDIAVKLGVEFAKDEIKDLINGEA